MSYCKKQWWQLIFNIVLQEMLMSVFLTLYCTIQWQRFYPIAGSNKGNHRKDTSNWPPLQYANCWLQEGATMTSVFFMLHRDNNNYIFTLITREQAKTSSNKLNGINQRMIIPLNCLVNNQLQPSRECASAGARHSRVDGQQRHHRLWWTRLRPSALPHGSG